MKLGGLRLLTGFEKSNATAIGFYAHPETKGFGRDRELVVRPGPLGQLGVLRVGRRQPVDVPAVGAPSGAVSSHRNGCRLPKNR